ncbi:MAG: Small, acid-soluble spore protein [Pelotomaculum sp. PtaB.Bin013]|uniref:Alpha/beta-type small acid-soluble spore protein n=1 Tax=Pelotomaculum isophthalicicum JI TaxID=947010 RepID=A0A9X4JTB2_9FIRM|nr:small, acid-soluble spore protein, alpha/beta type [Pelotomaculum isophthalicicum]MDF9408484.1 alpha/beta-type small acid-soluble spore protein [Pelotomaculum isophthalicicum JI]OPX91492.1 MAG: Small, acid-soluble spore protein [Pelotomaculum sp. PtaB.Bin013]
MSRRRGGVMSERLKYELADELGVGGVVRRDGGYFGNVSSKNCGNLVRLAIERAEQTMAGNNGWK